MRTVVFLGLCILFLSSVFAQSNYADIHIIVDSNGLVSIEGLTNTPEIIVKDSTEFTTKDGSFWLLNISLGRYDNLKYSIQLPEHASVNYIKTPDLSRFSDTHGGLIITGESHDKPALFIIQYSILEESQNYMLYYYLLGLLVLGGALVILYKQYFLRIKHLNTLKKSLTQRQKAIITLLSKHGGKMTQKELEEKTQLVKSSLSRNIDSLVRREIITKKQVGMSNVIEFRTVPPHSGKK